jgi:AGCS family alanine or glycine:cation symporter
MLAGFGIGNGVQAFEVSSALESAGVPRLITGIVLGAAVFAVVIGGIRRIAQAASTLVPLMSVLYIGACLVLLLINAAEVPNAFGTIFGNAFSGEAACRRCVWSGCSDGVQARHLLQ